MSDGIYFREQKMFVCWEKHDSEHTGIAVFIRAKHTTNAYLTANYIYHALL